MNKICVRLISLIFLSMPVISCYAQSKSNASPKGFVPGRIDEELTLTLTDTPYDLIIRNKAPQADLNLHRELNDFNMVTIYLAMKQKSWHAWTNAYADPTQIQALANSVNLRFEKLNHLVNLKSQGGVVLLIS